MIMMVMTMMILRGQRLTQFDLNLWMMVKMMMMMKITMMMTIVMRMLMTRMKRIHDGCFNGFNVKKPSCDL